MASPGWRDERIYRNRRLSKKRPIPGGITLDDFRKIQKYLADIFQDIDQNTGRTGSPRELHMRLNESEKPWPLPIFVGWHEALNKNGRMQFNHPHPALWRFGDDVLSESTRKPLILPMRKATRHFSTEIGVETWQKKELAKEPPTQRRETYSRRALRLVIENETPRVPVNGETGVFRCAVGTLVLGFEKPPAGDLLNKAHEIMRAWALEKVAKTDPKRGALIAWLKQEFDLGGPLLRATPNNLDNRWLDRR